MSSKVKKTLVSFKFCGIINATYLLYFESILSNLSSEQCAMMI